MPSETETCPDAIHRLRAVARDTLDEHVHRLLTDLENRAGTLDALFFRMARLYPYSFNNQVLIYHQRIEAEATAYVVMGALGLGELPRADPSWSYIDAYGGRAEHVVGLLKRIHAGAHTILDAIRGRPRRRRIPDPPDHFG
jgi:hypothetical protein